MDAQLQISVGSILAVVGFLFQIGITVAAIAFSHGGLNQRVRAVEEKVKDHGLLATSVTRLETEMEGVSREIKGLREDLKLVRNELRNEMRYRTTESHERPPVRPYDFPDGRRWVLEDEQ
jgi:hypothetical protein